ncbi:MAG: PIN domain-containing protein [Peptococcaceae bacterium]|nr:PIN domain-containing protein [Peptococcaceae bacterium]
MRYYLDTNICIRILNTSSQSVINKFEGIDLDDIMIPSVVAAELIYGAYKSAKRDRNLMRCREFLSQFRIAVPGAEAIEAYGTIRTELEGRGTPIGSNDYFIAALVKANGGVLVTNNTREFSRVDGLALEDWTEG